ncbi:MAG: hypothetical protein K2G84_06955 [Muribaculaceae bacterium]|nr:hypothetical protein [Muribaculaceae bacterium]
MLITIFDKSGSPKAEISPGDNSTQTKEIHGDNVLALSFIHHDHIGLDVDDQVDYLGERYWLCEKYRPRQKSAREWVYDIKLYGVESLLRNILVIKMVDGEDEPVFTLTAPPREHVAMIVRCMNEGMGNISDWKVGRVEGTGNIVIDYFGKYCDEALKEIADKTGTEWWVEGQTVNLCRCEHGEPVVLGYDKGLLGIEPDRADNVKFYTRLYPVGSSRNIDPEKYGRSRLQLPDGRKYVEVNADKYGRVDHYEESAFGDIYPRRVGVVSAVRYEERTGEDGNPFTTYYFKDDSMGFDPNEYELPGQVKRVSFQEGSELGGLGTEEDGTYFFEVNFDSKTREFEIITIWPYKDSAQQLPGGNLVPKPGNEYILWNLRMPDEYYGLAEKEFLEAVEQYNEEHGLDITVFKSSTDHTWIEDNGVELSIGRRVRLESGEYFPEDGFRESRITKITRKVNLPSSMEIEIGDTLGRSARQKFTDDINDARSYARSMSESVAMPDIIRMGDKTIPTDNNLFSARRTLDEALSRKRPDQAYGLKRFLDGVEVGDFATGIKGARVTAAGDGEVESLKVRKEARVGTDLAVGRKVTVGNYIPGVSGGVFYIDENGEAHIETGQMTVNGKLRVKEIEVQQQTWVGGAQILSPAGMVCEKVEPRVNGQGAVTGWKCLFRTQAPDGRKVWNQFRVGDLARCETFNLVDDDGYLTNRYYWRMVTEVGYETDAEGARWGYILLSNVEGNYDPESVGAGGVPLPGDSIVTMGVAGSLGDGNDDRRSLVILSSCGEGSPYIYQFKGINSFSLPASKLKTRISPGGNLFTGRFIVEAEGRDLEEITGIIDRMKPYSLHPSVRSVLVFHHEDAETGETFPSFSPVAFTCGLFKSSGTGETAKVGWGSLPPGMEVRATVRRHDAASGVLVDDPAYTYRGEVIHPEEDMRSVTFTLLIDGHTADETAVSVQTDATALASEYRASLEVTEKAIEAQATKTNLLEQQTASLRVTASNISSKVGRISANLIRTTPGMWDNPSQSFRVNDEEGGFSAEEGADLDSVWQTFRCPIDTSRFKPSTDYTLSLDARFQTEDEESEVSQGKMAFRASVSDVTQKEFLCPWAVPDVAAYTPGEETPLRFRLRTPAVLPTQRMYLQFIIRDWDDRTEPIGLSFLRIKLEEGTVGTPWVPADKDLESIIDQQAGQIALSVKVDGKERAGVTLDEEEGITLQADKVRIKNGDLLAALFKNGILNANLIEVNRLATKAGGKTRVTIGEFDDAFIRFYHDDGVTLALKLGLDYVSLEEDATLKPLSAATMDAGVSQQDSTLTPIFKQGKPAVAQVFDEEGVLTWVLFLDGPVTPDTQPYSWRTYSLVRETASNQGAIRLNQSLRAQECWQFKVRAGVSGDYTRYGDKFFVRKMSDADFTSASSYYLPDGRYFFPSPELRPTTIDNPQTVWIRRYHDIEAGAIKASGHIILTD